MTTFTKRPEEYDFVRANGTCLQVSLPFPDRLHTLRLGRREIVFKREERQDGKHRWFIYREVKK